MTQEDRELLLRDIMMRASYGVICYYSHKFVNTEIGIGKIRSIYIEDCLLSDFSGIVINSTETGLGYIKPYLRSLSDMTEEEADEFRCDNHYDFFIDFGHSLSNKNGKYRMPLSAMKDYIRWLVSKHFDINGLIEKDLAIKVTKENNPYEEKI